MADVRIPPQRQRTVDQTPTLIKKEQHKLALRQKLHIITSLIPVLLAILEEQGVSVPYRIMGKNYKATDAFNRRLGLQKDNFTQGIHALAILLARSNASVSVCAGDASMSMPPSDSVILLAATDVGLPKSLPAFPGKQYITLTHSHGAEAIGGVVNQTFSPDRALLQILKNPSDHIYRLRRVKDKRAFLPHVGVIMGFVNVLRELRASMTNSSIPSAQLRMSHSESQPDSSQTDSVEPTVNADGQTQERFRWLVNKLGLYIVSVFFPAMSRRFCHPVSQRLFDIISSIDSTAVANAFNVYAKDTIRRSPPLHHDIRLLRLLRTEGFADFVQTHGLSICHLQALALAPGSNTLYTQETCSEFHSLLCGLLRGYSDALSSLTAQCGSTTLSLEEFKQKVQDTCLYLKPLVLIAYSNLIVTHLATLLPLLRPLLSPPSPAHPWIDSDDAISSMCNGHDPAANDANCADLENASEHYDLDADDEDLLTLMQAQGSISADILVLKWLHIQVIHLAAVDVVAGCVQAIQKPMSITFVAGARGPYRYNGMQPWKEAISDLSASASTKDGLDAEAIILLEDYYRHYQRFPNSSCHPHYTPTVYRTMSGLMQSEPEFLGRVHPSAMLAAWLAHRDRPDSIEGFKTLHPPIIGASEISCFICTELLRSSQRHGTEVRLEMHGSRPTVHPCAIPPRLSTKVVQKMVDTFSVILRQLLDIALSAKQRKQHPPSPQATDPSGQSNMPFPLRVLLYRCNHPDSDSE